MVVPDIGGWRRDRLSAIPNAPYMTIAPDWVCETLSPSTAKLDRAEKLPVYAREGVKHVWLVDPLARVRVHHGPRKLCVRADLAWHVALDRYRGP